MLALILITYYLLLAGEYVSLARYVVDMYTSVIYNIKVNK